MVKADHPVSQDSIAEFCGGREETARTGQISAADRETFEQDPAEVYEGARSNPTCSG